jgi:hypothetical protein
MSASQRLLAALEVSPEVRPGTAPALVDAFRAEVLREAAAAVWEMANAAPTPSQCTCLASTSFELRRMADHVELGKGSPPAESTQPERLAILRDAVDASRGEWTTHRTLNMFQAAGVPVTRAACRQMLAALQAEGLLGCVERTGRRYFVPTGGAS